MEQNLADTMQVQAESFSSKHGPNVLGEANSPAFTHLHLQDSLKAGHLCVSLHEVDEVGNKGMCHVMGCHHHLEDQLCTVHPLLHYLSVPGVNTLTHMQVNGSAW